MVRILIALSIANAMLADKDQHPHLSLDDILKKYEHKEPAHDDSMEKFDDDYLAHEHVNDLHHSVLDVHEKAANLLADSMPTLAPIMHPDSPLTHHDRLSAVLQGLDHDEDKKEDLGATPEDEDAKEEAPKDEKKDEAPAEAAAPVEDPDTAPKEADDAKEEAPDAEAKEAPAADADAPPVKEEASPDKAKVALVEKTLLAKMGKSLKMMAMLHMLVKPIEAKLQAAMGHMPPEAQKNAKEVMAHMASLDKLTGAALGLMVGVKQAAHGTDQEKKAALLKMIVGLAAIEKGVKENLMAMKMRGPPMGMHAHAGPTNKLHLLLQKMQSKVDAELADPARKDDPLVAIDVKMLDTMKKAVKKAEALVVVGAIAMKKAKNASERMKIKASVKGAMKKVMGQLKQDINEFKEQAMVTAQAAIEKAKEQEEAEKAEKGDLPEEPKPDDEEKSDGGELKGLLDKINGIAAADKDTANLRSH